MANDREIDWQHDIKSGKCIDEDNVEITAAFPISDYKAVRNKYHFDIIEFSGDLYFVKRVKLDDQRVEEDLELLKAGTIGSIFGCKTRATVPTIGSKSSQSSLQTAKPEGNGIAMKALIWVTNIALILVLVIIVFMVYDLLFPNDPIR